MKELVKIIKEFQNDSTKNGKASLLEKYKDNELFREVLYFLLNPYIVTGISTKKMQKETKTSVKEYPATIKEVLEYLKENFTGKDTDVLSMQLFVNSLSTDEEKEIASQIVTKKLKIGVSASTVNKAYGKGTIPQFDVMKAEAFRDKNKHIDGEFYVTLKLDGNRCVVVNGENGVKFFSSSGREMTGLEHLEEQFKHLPQGWTYDGEVLASEEAGETRRDTFNKTQSLVKNTKAKKGKLNYYIFDMIPSASFQNNDCTLKYSQRRKLMDKGLEMSVRKSFGTGMADLTPNIKVLKVLYRGSDKDAIMVAMKAVTEKGEEGVMINRADGLYRAGSPKRTTDIQKLKEFKTADLLVVSMEMAIDGQFKDLVGRLNVEYKGYLVGVASGLTPDMRERFAKNPDEIIGKVIEVQYHDESKDKDGNLSLNLPVFKRIRDDKTADDVNYGE